MFMFRARTLGLLLPLFIGCASDVKVGTFNTPPAATITSHADGDEVYAGTEVLLTGNVSDADGASFAPAARNLAGDVAWAEVRSQMQRCIE